MALGPHRAGLAAAVAFAVGSAAGPAQGAASAWFETEQGAVRLISASDTVGDAESLALGLQFRLNPDWKIYWRSPGDAGFPPEADWSGSDNLAEARIAWPAPRRFSVLGLETLGYHDRVVLPIAVSPRRSGEALRLEAKLRYLTCDQICIPYDTELSLALPAGPATTAPEAATIAEFARLVPTTGSSAGLAVTEASLSAAEGGKLLHVAVTSVEPFADPDLYVEGPAGYGFSAPAMSYSPDRRRALMRIGIGAPAKSTGTLAGVPLTFTLVDGKRAVEARLAPIASIPSPSPQAARSASGLAAALALALLGGLILNLMPCVLPVLSIKLLSVVGHGGGEARRVRAGFAASAAGIIASFLVLGSAAVALKQAGLAAGWGIQFQQPIFLAAMIVVLALFAGNLWGAFAVRLPGAVADAAATARHRPGLAGHFFTGALATLLATPCSAPFLGTAVGFALARGPAEIYAVFLALGAGLALPYLAIAAAPRLATRLPRPGRWMVVLRRILGLALVGTAAWLAVVLAALAGIAATVAVAALAAGAVAMLGLTRRRVGVARGFAWGAVATLAMLAIAVPELAGSLATSGAASAEAGPWRGFDAGAIADEVRLGRVVVVEVTADWCITCKVNKRAVLDREPVRGRLARPDVTAMLADWTRPDARIARYLAGFGRYGIPFTAVYGPAAPGGEVLPELLTERAVIEAITRAEAKK